MGDADLSVVICATSDLRLGLVRPDSGLEETKAGEALVKSNAKVGEWRIWTFGGNDIFCNVVCRC